MPPDFGRAEAALVLPAQSCLRVTCGEVTFDVQAADVVEEMPRPWLGGDWHQLARYLAAVAAVFIGLLTMAYAIPGDPRTLSLDDLGLAKRYDDFRIVPVVAPQVNAPGAAAKRNVDSPNPSGAISAASDPESSSRSRPVMPTSSAPDPT